MTATAATSGTSSGSTTETCESKVLTYLSSSNDACIDDTYPWSIEHGLDPLTVIGAINSLLTEEYVTTQDLSTTFYTLTAEGEFIFKNGSQEMIVYNAIKSFSPNSPSLEELESKISTSDICKIGLGNCLKNKWISKNGNQYQIIASNENAAAIVVDTIQQALQALSNGSFLKDAIDDKVRTPKQSVFLLVQLFFFV
jgi:phenylalanyl-tRNA synthetase alpha chain